MSRLTTLSRRAAIEREGKHLMRLQEAKLHNLMPDISPSAARAAAYRTIRIVGRNAKAAAKLAAELEAAHDELVAALAAAKARR
jgi:hypothetical protein